MKIASWFVRLGVIATLCSGALGQTPTPVLTWHYDNTRTGQNLNETILTPQNVNVGSFGKVLSYPVDGMMYAQPLYVPNVNIPDQGTHNVVYVATENDSVYAFDADGLGPNPLWHVNYLDPANGVTTVPCIDEGDACNIYPIIGITATPVIDPTTGTMYLVARTKENGTYVHRLHAIDIASGVEKFGGPVLIQASVKGTGTGSINGMVPFNGRVANQRAALLLNNGTLYVAWTGVHGWVMSFNPHTLALLNVFNSTPNSQQHGGIWMAGGGMAADSAGNVYFAVAEAGFDILSGGQDWGETLLKVSPQLQVLDYFSPSDQVCRVPNDYDLASGGPLLLPPQAGTYPNEIIQAGKGGTPCDDFSNGTWVPVYLVNRDHMGGYNAQLDADIETVEGIPVTLGTQGTGNGGYWANPAYWQGPNGQYVYLSGLSGEGGIGDYLKAFSLSNGLLSTTPAAESANKFPIGSTPSVSANGTSNGIVWSIERQDILAAQPGTKPAVLYAYDASNVATMLYNSSLAGTRDQAGAAVKFVTPMVANGKVYVGTQTELDVYGLLGQTLPAPAIKLSSPSLGFGNQVVGSTSLQQSITLTNSGSAALDVTSIVSSGDYALNPTATSCPYNGGFVSPAATCTLDVVFTPTLLGSQGGTITITSNVAGGPQIVNLTGAGANPTFSVFLQPGVNPIVGSNPQGVAVADFNGDKIPDIAVANSGAGTVSILLGNGDGTFTLKATVATGSGATAVIAGNFNGGTIVDLAVANQTANTVSILVGNGDGTFSKRTLTGFSGPSSLAVADFNNDHNLDLAVGNSSNGTVAVLLGNGQGNFTLKPLSTGGSPSALAASDFNSDNNQDLAVVDSTDGWVSIYLGNGDGTFTLKSAPAVGNDPVSIAVGDWNHDTHPDLAVVNSTSNTMSVLLGNGDGTFQSAVNYSSLSTPQTIVTADLNADGNPDLAVTNSSANTVSIFLGNGDGTFQVPLVSNTGTAPYGLAASDFNGDGWQDLVAANSGAGSLSILLQAPQASLSASSVGFGEQNTGSSSASQEVVLNNAGEAALNVSSVVVNGADPGDFAVTNSCSPLPVKLSGGGECRFGITFTPSATGARSASLVIGDNAGSGTQTVTLTGTGIAPAVTLSSSTLNFGNVVLSASAKGSALLSNTGTGPLAITSIVPAGDYALAATPTSCPYSGGLLSAGQNCTLDVVFTPTQYGTRSGSLTISDNASGGSQVVSLVGSGISAILSATPRALFFGTQDVKTTSNAKTITLQNLSPVAASISINITGSDPSDFSQTNNCPSSLAKQASCTISVTFTPSRSGARTAAVTISETGASSPITLGLTGTGVAPTVTLSSSLLTFPSQTVGTTSSPQVVTLKNTGTVTLIISSLTISGGNAGDYAQTNTCGSSVLAGASCTISVTFTPTAKGTRRSAVAITDNAGNGQTIKLTGTGI